MTGVGPVGRAPPGQRGGAAVAGTGLGAARRHDAVADERQLDAGLAVVVAPPGQSEVVGGEAGQVRGPELAGEGLPGRGPGGVERAGVLPPAGPATQPALVGGQRTFERLDHVEQRDVGRRPGEGVATRAPGPREHEPRSLELVEHLVQEPGRDVHRLGDVGRLGHAARVLRQVQEGPHGVVGAPGGDDLHGRNATPDRAAASTFGRPRRSAGGRRCPLRRPRSPAAGREARAGTRPPAGLSPRTRRRSGRRGGRGRGRSGSAWPGSARGPPSWSGGRSRSAGSPTWGPGR